jgi:hypothetical protein
MRVRRPTAARYRARPPLRPFSRDTVDGALPRYVAMLRWESPAQIRREISSRSRSVRTRALRRRDASIRLGEQATVQSGRRERLGPATGAGPGGPSHRRSASRHTRRSRLLPRGQAKSHRNCLDQSADGSGQHGVALLVQSDPRSGKEPRPYRGAARWRFHGGRRCCIGRPRVHSSMTGSVPRSNIEW